jgi:hypothetical protein
MSTHFQQHVDRLRDVLADFNRDWENDCAKTERELRIRIHELEQEKAQRGAREPLLKEVKRAYEAYLACALEGRQDPSNEEAALFDALSKLARWKP